MKTFVLPDDNYAYNGAFSWGKSCINHAFWFVISWQDGTFPNCVRTAVQDDFGNLVEVAA